MNRRPPNKGGVMTAAILLTTAFLLGGGAYLAVRDTLGEDVPPDPEPFRLQAPQVGEGGIAEPQADAGLIALPPIAMEPDEPEPQPETSYAPEPAPEPTPKPETEPAPEPLAPVSSAPAVADVAVKELFIKPVDGAISKPWSGEELVWSETLCDYRAHGGCDIAAPAGSKVRAMQEGEISDIYSDELLGTVIEIDHGNGVITRYCNLLDGQLAGIETGAKVKMGDVISGVGDTALSEAGEAPHLHLEAFRDGARIDPQALFE